ncbi:hypothetical protein [Paenibacillus sp.]|uniref:hypothetical protein n=1 Tax=Paenibacillus sp. TaxID=58172 RepID=UPI002D48DBC7|nr:hypothetical protein [Paenibacillus sp.]HZG83787.1 hypothetical protein [Paenibacillus sp.]
MKIAFENKKPDMAALHRLLDAAPAADERYKLLLSEGEDVVAAYDGDLLVGVGAAGAVMIHPRYAHRDIEHNMRKLARR